MDDVVIARALHVLAVIHWIGGLTFVTCVILPIAARRGAAEGLSLFAAVERRFSAQLRASIPLAGATGLWMTYRMDLWGRFIDPRFWWMSAMLGLWLLFVILVFVLEPLLHERMEAYAYTSPASALRLLKRMHVLLLSLSAITAFGAVSGANGLDWF